MTKEICIGSVKIGGNNPIAIQSMCNTDTRDVYSTVSQIKALEEAGCEIVRVAVIDKEAAEAIKEIRKNINIPLVADIHFDYRLAIESMKNGADKIRINPGNIGNIDNTKKVVSLAKERNIPLRIGVNAGSLEKEILSKYNGITPEGLVESALNHVRILESLDFYDTVISIKSSSVPISVKAYELLSHKTDYPLHIGITEAGTVFSGSIKSAVGIGIMLSKGIGDTLRVSLTGDPVLEIRAAKDILKALELRKFGAQIVSCPTCGRTKIDLIGLANKVEDLCQNIDKNIKIAVMGCAVNGPGEARDADIGIAGGNGEGLIFKKGEIVKKVPEDQLIDELMKEISTL